MLFWRPKTAFNSRNHSSNALNFGCVLAFYLVVGANISMLSTRICIVPIDAGLENRRNDMHTVKSEVMKAIS